MKIFHIDINPNEKEIEFLDKIDSLALKRRSEFKFIKRGIFLAPSELNNIVNYIPNRYPKKVQDTLKSYSLYFTCFDEFSHFSFYGVGKTTQKQFLLL